MQDAATQDRRQNEHANCGFYAKIAKWRRWRHAPRLTATAVIMDSRHRFSNIWHIADVKNITGDEQTTLMVHRNSANIACTFLIYVYLRLWDRDCCSAADGSGSCHAPALSYFEEMTRCRRQRLHWRWPGNPKGRSKFRNLGLFTFTRSQLTLWRRLRGLCVKSGIRLTVSICRYRSSRAAGWRYHFAGSVLAGPPDNSIILQKIV